MLIFLLICLLNISVLNEISELLETGLSKEELAIIIRLCEAGLDPERLATLVEKLRDSRTLDTLE